MKRTSTSKNTWRWDAGDAGCGRLIMGLQAEMGKLEDGQRLEVIARDPAASIDLPCWCHLTGHTLLTDTHPIFVIRKRRSNTMNRGEKDV